MLGFNILVSQYVEEINFEPGEASVDIKVTQEMVDDLNIIDQGLLIGIIDTWSSFASSVLLEGEENQKKVSVSVNIKVNSFGEMFLNEKYKMKVFLKSHVGKIILYEIHIVDKDDKLIKLATHLKKIVNAKF